MSRTPYVAINIPNHGGEQRLGCEQLVRHFHEEITSGRLRPGMRVPPVRSLEQRLGISKNTAQAAYDELAARGLLESRARSGVFVAKQTDALERGPLYAASPALLHNAGVIPNPQVPQGRVRLDMVFIDPELLPREQLSDCVRSVLANPGLKPFYDAQGHPGLRAQVAERLNQRGMDVDPEDVILTQGSQQALDMVARSLKHKVIATENPVYSFARLLFANLGCQTVPLTLDPFKGIDLDEWEEVLRSHSPALVYAIPNFQNPTGYSYSTRELEKLLELSEKLGFAILEDDWGSDMLSGTEYRPTLRALGGRNVLYVNSFTKKLLPSLRLGYIVASPETRGALLAAKRLATLGNSTLIEATLAEFMDRGYYDTHLNRVHAELDVRYKACIERLAEVMPEGVRFSLPGGGPTLWLELPSAVDVRKLQERLQARNVEIQLPYGHFYGRQHLNGFRVSYAFPTRAAIHDALGVVAEELRALLSDGHA
ncbi:MAG TPA: PLP-dependent aminotransferase family protein [Polyangiaceae bacterium]|jgi:DNA-binding transcriptional MocR family regulator|nr:PLP-dependent aminotransferase family protein [Polyangiaceae bacterium]